MNRMENIRRDEIESPDPPGEDGREADAPTEEPAEIEGWDDDKKSDTVHSDVEAPAEDEQAPVVCIKGLKKSFKDHEVLKGVDLHVNKGENLVVLGKSGSGKSVLIKCLVGLEYPDAGDITVLEEDISRLNYDELNALRVRVGFLFQNAALYDSMTVRENLSFALRQQKKKLPREK